MFSCHDTDMRVSYQIRAFIFQKRHLLQCGLLKDHPQTTPVNHACLTKATCPQCAGVGQIQQEPSQLSRVFLLTLCSTLTASLTFLFSSIHLFSLLITKESSQNRQCSPSLAILLSVFVGKAVKITCLFVGLNQTGLHPIATERELTMPFFAHFLRVSTFYLSRRFPCVDLLLTYRAHFIFIDVNGVEHDVKALQIKYHHSDCNFWIYFFIRQMFPEHLPCTWDYSRHLKHISGQEKNPCPHVVDISSISSLKNVFY